MIGDSEVDVQTACNAGMFAVAVNYGFGVHDRTAHPADLYIDSLRDLVAPHARSPPLNHREESFRYTKPLHSPTRFCQTHRVVIGLFPELDAPGGIQRASRHMAFVLSEFAASRQMEYRMLSLNDTQELHRMRVGEREFVFTGAARGKARFAASALRAVRRNPKLVLAAHVNLGPIVRAMQHGGAAHEKHRVHPRHRSVGAAFCIASSRFAPRLLGACSQPRHCGLCDQPAGGARQKEFAFCLGGLIRTLTRKSPASPLPRCRRNFHPGRVVLTVGRWLATERYKGMDTLMTALPRLLLRWPELQLVFIGCG